MRPVTFACFLFLFAGCSKRVERSEIPGDFYGDFGRGTNVLSIRSDGTYVHIFHPPGGSNIRITNKWDFEDWKGRQLITFYGYSADPSSNPRSDAFWPVEVERSGRVIKLSTDPELHRYFIKR